MAPTPTCSLPGCTDRRCCQNCSGRHWRTVHAHCTGRLSEDNSRRHGPDTLWRRLSGIIIRMLTVSERWLNSSRLRIHTPILGKHFPFATECTLAQTHSSKCYALCCLQLINSFWVMDVLSQKIRMCFIVLVLLNAVGISFAVKRTYVRGSGKLMSSPALSWSSDNLLWTLCSSACCVA